ncbi:MAG: C69 family dipeptidase, partial [Sphaerochaetaceae bacterium]|nr:C69 family dipeptidase [Sphaerochaetaceae bacterium]
MKKVALTALLLLLIAAESVFACTIFAVGKEATTDGSTMVSHTCDSTSDDLRLWLIPTQEAGTERDVVINGRKGQDYSQYPNLGYENGMVVGSYTFTEDTNQYIHAMYSFINDKGLAMGESTCGYDRNSEQGKKLSAAFKNVDGIWDCYMIQDLALETCSTAREAVELMG